MSLRPEPRKKKRHYRFNGVWGMDGGLQKLKAQLRALQTKLADPDDSDDSRWVKSWIAATEAEIVKKESGTELKQRERRKGRTRRTKGV